MVATKCSTVKVPDRVAVHFSCLVGTMCHGRRYSHASSAVSLTVLVLASSSSGGDTTAEPTAVGSKDSASFSSGRSDSILLGEMVSACSFSSACASKIDMLTARRVEDAVTAALAVGVDRYSASKGDGDGYYRLVLLLGQVSYSRVCADSTAVRHDRPMTRHAHPDFFPSCRSHAWCQLPQPSDVVVDAVGHSQRRTYTTIAILTRASKCTSVHNHASGWCVEQHHRPHCVPSSPEMTLSPTSQPSPLPILPSSPLVLPFHVLNAASRQGGSAGESGECAREADKWM